MPTNEIRSLLALHGRLPVDIGDLRDDSDLFDSGLTSLNTVSLMLAIEERFEIEFPDGMLGRKTFRSIRSLSHAVCELQAAMEPAR